jgi:predicted amidohydrolase YtcJ
MNYFSSFVLNASLATCLAAVLFLGAGCGESPDRSAAAPVDAESVDLLFHNGQILIVDDAFSIHSVLAVSDGKVVASGGEELLDHYRARKTVDLSGQTLMPGFVDSHTHISGDARRYIDMTDVSSIVEIQSLVRDKAALLGSGEWITGYGWSEDELAEQRKPTRYDLGRCRA